MKALKTKGLNLLDWQAGYCKITSVKCNSYTLLTGQIQTALAVDGIITLELGKNCGVRFAWKAQELVEATGSSGKFEYSVDVNRGVTTQGLVFEDDAGESLSEAHYNHIIHRLGSDTVTLWSATVSHYLKSLR
jgi:hypothetical protein